MPYAELVEWRAWFKVKREMIENRRKKATKGR